MFTSSYCMKWRSYLTQSHKRCKAFPHVFKLKLCCVPFLIMSMETSNSRNPLWLPYGVDRCEEHIKHLHIWLQRAFPLGSFRRPCNSVCDWKHPHTRFLQSLFILMAFCLCRFLYFLLMMSFAKYHILYFCFWHSRCEKSECFNKRTKWCALWERAEFCNQPMQHWIKRSTVINDSDLHISL